jgi:hypothetical protein
MEGFVMSGTIRAMMTMAALATALSFLMFGLSCNTFEGEQKPNQPPDVWLTSGPPEGGVSTYRVRFFWNAWDKDGSIQYFEFAITDNEDGAFDPADTTGPEKWTRTTLYDSTFAFSADEISDTASTDMITEFTRSHTFFIRAVDDKGLVSVNAAYRSFTARTLSPTVDIIFPEFRGLNPVLLPTRVTFHWIAADYIDDITSKQEPESVRWIMVPRFEDDVDWQLTLQYIRQNSDAPEWSEWQDYWTPSGTGYSLTLDSLDFGGYLFAVQARDEAGAVTPVFDERRNVRRLMISRRYAGPKIKLCSDVLNTCWESTSLRWGSVDLPANTPLTFTLELDDDRPGSPAGSTFEYCYGWDIGVDPYDPTCAEWIKYPGRPVPVPVQSWHFGSHTFYVVARNDMGYTSYMGIKINVIPFTMERDLLVVDDFREDPTACGIENTNGAVPCDDEHDAFWEDVLQNVDGFEPAIDLIEVNRFDPLIIDKLAQYKNVIWNVRGGYNLQDGLMPLLYNLIKFTPSDPDKPTLGPANPNLLVPFLAAGGHVLICGKQPMTMAIDNNKPRDPKFPFIFKYELDGNQDGRCGEPVGEHSFAFRDMCLDVLDIAYTNYNSLRTSGSNGCGATHIRGVRPREDGLREATPIDMSFPALTLRPEVAGPGKHFAPESRGLNNEIYNPMYFTCCGGDLGPRTCFEPIYGHGCLDTSSPLYESPVAVWTNSYADVVPDVQSGVAVAARSAVWGFEPFFFEPNAVRSALEVILFDEWQLPSK